MQTLTRGEVRTRRLVLVDDHEMVRQGLKRLLEEDEGMRVVGEARNAEEALEVLGRTSCDFVLLDVNLPGRDGLWALERIRQLWPALPVLILTMLADGAVARRAFDLGARAYVLKDSSAEALLDALRAAGSGNSYVSPRVLSLFLEVVRTRPAPDPLTPRERDVLGLLGKGLSNDEIGHALHLSLSTVKTHLRAMYSRLGTNRAGLVVEAVRRGLVVPRGRELPGPP